MPLDSEEFAREIVRESNERGKQLAKKIYDTDEPLTNEETIAMCQNFMWTEFHLGVIPPARQMSFLYEKHDDISQDLDIMLGLADQIRDEIKHSKLFSRRVEELGGNPNIMTYEPPDAAVFIYERTVGFDDPLGLAASLQCSGEPTLAAIYETILENDLVDQRTQEVIYQAKIDEGNHINVGKKIIGRYATDEESQSYIKDVIESKFEALYEFHGFQMEPIE